MGERLDIGKADELDNELESLKKSAREKIMGVIEKLRNDPNFIINIEKETSESIVLGLRVFDPKSKDFKTYHKGFMKVSNFPDGLSVEEEVEKQIRFPEGNNKGA